ncbi:hypothetical protein [Sphingomonas sanguinis]|uniref:hypothetical protein n=1 Tax=Sphingomonas sanguinis TaxID=33051 RepID=UPI000B0E6A57|nr:hypothetical protein [Sphingomonas sanguinis]
MNVVLRTIFVLLTVGIGYIAVSDSIARRVETYNPVLAHSLRPNDGRITSILASFLSQDGAAKGNASKADQLAKLALRQDATAVLAAETLGASADAQGHADAADAAFAYSDRLSRREVRTRLWMIERAVDSGDVSVSLHQYDTALRVLPNLADLLYPVLAGAASDPQITPAFVALLSKRPSWTQSFVEYVASKGPDRGRAAVLLRQLSRVGVPVSQSATSYVINALLGENRYPEAWSYYVTVRPGVDRHRSRDPEFKAGLEAPSKFDWVAANDGTISGALEGGVFEFSAPPSIGGAILHQIQWLPAGRYRMTGSSSKFEGAVRTLPFWSLSCANGRELGRVYLGRSGAFSGDFTVPTDCPQQTLALVVQATDDMSGITGQITHAELVAAR